MAYESLSFESGETLTSTKMNKMAGNDASFHDGTGIDDGAISGSKLNFASIGSKIVTSTYDDSVGTTATKIASITLDPGSYIIIACGPWHDALGGNFKSISFDLKNGTSRLGSINAPANPTNNGLYIANPCLLTKATLTQQSTLDLYANTTTSEAAISQMLSMNLAAIRIG